MNRNYLRLLIIIFLLSSVASTQVLSQIVITEFMADPAAVSDVSGEWFEITNVSSQPVDINGWHIKDNGTNNHTINNGGPLMMNPGAILVLGNNIDNLTNGGVTIDYEYSSFTLTNSGGDEIIITDASNSVIDSVVYTTTTSGKSWNLDPTHYNTTDNDNFAYWCLSTTTYGSGDFGTPGAINVTCASGIPAFPQESNFIVRTTATELLVHWSASNQKQSWNIIDLSGRIILCGTVSENSGDLSVPLKKFAAGIYSFRFENSSRAEKFIVQ